MSVTLGQIDTELNRWAPSGTAQSYDNVGIQIGRASAEVSKCIIALDLTPDVVSEAQALGANCIITHHPLIFRPLTSLTDGDLVSSMALTLAESSIALYGIHTNLDAARGGVSFELARKLGLQDVEFLSGLGSSIVKLVVFIPTTHIDEVRDAAFAAGAGNIGRYTECSFSHGGTGSFRPTEGASPVTGEPGGKRESVSEIRLEMEVNRSSLRCVLSAVHTAHPYDEVAHDIIPVEQESRNAGIGAVGLLPGPIPLRQFLNDVCDKLENPALRYVGDPEAMVHRVAVCGGSGSDFIEKALNTGADVYVTSDVTYHRFFETLNNEGQPAMAIVDAGHYETEKMTEALLVGWLREHIPDVDWVQTKIRTSPVQTWSSNQNTFAD